MSRLAVPFLALCLALPYVPETFAHGGGLDSRGCHRETATGGYHCHRNKDNELGAVLLVVVVLGVTAWWLTKRRNDNPPSFLPESEPEHRSWVDNFQLTASAGEDESIGVTWKFEF